MSNPFEDMLLPCPEDICDGSGEVLNEETGRLEACPHTLDPWAVEPNKDNYEHDFR